MQRINIILKQNLKNNSKKKKGWEKKPCKKIGAQLV